MSSLTMSLLRAPRIERDGVPVAFDTARGAKQTVKRSSLEVHASLLDIAPRWTIMQPIKRHCACQRKFGQRSEEVRDDSEAAQASHPARAAQEAAATHL